MYQLTITTAERLALEWAAQRGYFPRAILRGMMPVEGTRECDDEITYTMPEHVAWSLLELREEDPDAYLACIGRPLLGRILDLEASIV